jgi:peptidoglycan/LPS O-acetylase OafA/YrhL
MDWSAYEIFSVVSGLLCIGLSLVPSEAGNTRLRSFLAGVFFVGYGWYVASQDSGTYVFPVAIFILPFLLAGPLAAKLVQARRSASDPGTKP